MSNTQTVQITSQGIQNSLSKFSPLKSLTEYIWNGFDAKASIVEININITALSTIDYIEIKDNGYGIDRMQLDNKFKPFLQSEKIYDPNERHSDTHGKNGVGRLTFFKFCDAASWKTIYKNEDNLNYEYTINIKSHSLEKFESAPEATLTTKKTGTSVCFWGVECNDFDLVKIKKFLINEFCWFLELHKKEDYKIIVNQETLDYSMNIVDKKTYDIFMQEKETKFEVDFVIWRTKLEEYSKFYYIDSNNKELAKENTTMNQKADRFYHSVFIRSTLFDNFDLKTNAINEQQALQGYRNKKSEEFVFIIGEVNRILRDMRRPFLKQSANQVIKEINVRAAFPNFDKTNPIDIFKQQEIESMMSAIYCAEPKIFSNLNGEQKKTLVRLLDLTMQSGQVNSLFNILEEIIVMDELEREELAEILEYTKMSNITRTIKLIKDRYLAVEELQKLVYKSELNANEVDHLQKFIEQHYWLFGEQYNLVTAAEPNFTEALRRYLKYLHAEYKDARIDHDDKLKQMDIFAVRQNLSNNVITNIVVELKHPQIAIGESQLSQVKKYMNVILSQDEFNASNMHWEFYLVGNHLNRNGYIQNEIESNKNHGEPSLVFKIQNYKIYVKTWSEIFSEFNLRHKFLDEKLEIERRKLQFDYNSAQQIIDVQKDNTAIQPAEMNSL